MSTPLQLGITCRQYLTACDEISVDNKAQTLSLDPILDTLPHVIRRPGMVYEVLVPGHEDCYEGECFCYAREKHVPPFTEVDYHLIDNLPEPYLPITKALDWTFTLEGIWEWVLLQNLWRHLPLFWHAGYSKVYYITDTWYYRWIIPEEIRHSLTHDWQPRKDYKEFIDQLEKDCRNAGQDLYMHSHQSWGYGSKEQLLTGIELARNTDEDWAPKVVQIDDNTIDLSFHLWNDWQGLKKVYLRAEVTPGKELQVNMTKEECIVKYKCGILF